MIDRNKIRKGVGTLVLVAALAASGVAFSNAQAQPVEEFSDPVLVMRADDVLRAEADLAKKESAEKKERIEKALSFIAPQENPVWIEPDIVSYNSECEAVVVPYGYSVYQFKNAVSGMLGVEVKDDCIWYIGARGHSMKGCFGVKNEYIKFLRLLDTLPEAIKNGTANKELYVELDKSINEDGMNNLRVPQGCKLFYVGDSEQKAEMLGIGFEKDGKDVTLEVGDNVADFSLWDTEVVTIPQGYSTDYIGLPSRLADALRFCEDMKAEMETYYNGLQQKAID